jgi:hypothetical protein
MTPDLWIEDKSSHYEYLAAYVNDILIWRKDPMEVLREDLLIEECWYP